MELIYLIALTCVGVLSHFLKKRIKGETLTDIITYFKTHFKSTLLTIFGAVGGFVLLKEMGELGYFSAFSIGYMADSFFNKAEERVNNGLSK
jgi:uncharacterized membrane protein YesL